MLDYRSSECHCCIRGVGNGIIWRWWSVMCMFMFMCLVEGKVYPGDL